MAADGGIVRLSSVSEALQLLRRGLGEPVPVVAKCVKA